MLRTSVMMTVNNPLNWTVVIANGIDFTAREAELSLTPIAQIPYRVRAVSEEAVRWLTPEMQQRLKAIRAAGFKLSLSGTFISYEQRFWWRTWHLTPQEAIALLDLLHDLAHEIERWQPASSG